jgi:radical SAM protein (TIGR01212 family)
MKPPHIRTFSYHYREKYGQPIGKIAVDIGHPCPNREKGGCIFCRSAGFTPAYLLKTDNIAAQIAKGKKSLLKGRFKKYFTYFQQETATAIAAEKLLPICDLALRDSDCIGIIISTRPDYIENEFLSGLAAILGSTRKECLIELGVQSAHEKSLTFLNRNHSFEDVRNAVQRIRQYKVFETGAHLILGIPGENEEDMIATVQTMCGMGISAVKLHHLQVIRDTPLHDMYVRGEVRLFSFEEYSQLLLKILPVISTEVTIHRLWATSHPDLLVAPRWNILAAVLSKKLLGKMVENGIYQGDRSN